MISVFRFLPLFAFLLATAAAQPVSVSVVPASYHDGDTLRLDVEAGTAAWPFSEVLSLTITYTCEGCTFDAGSAPFVSLTGSSWFADDSHWAESHEFSADRREYRLTLTRSDNQPRSGYGYLASPGGIIIEIEDILKREASVRASVSALARRPAAWPQPARGLLHLAPEGNWSLHDLNGRLLRSAQPGQALDVAGLPAGVYVARRSGASAESLAVLIE